MEKSPDAFRTISEVAEWLDIPTHVLRFWESRFSQIKPVKRAGGRRYYRPSDMRLIGGVKVLLHDQGMTIRAVQKALREQGIKHVAGFSPMLDGEAEDQGDVIDAVATETIEPAKAEPAPAARGTHSARPAPVAEPDAVDKPLDEEPELDLTAGLLDDDEPAPEEATPDPEPPAPAPVEEAPAAAEDAPIMFRRRPRPRGPIEDATVPDEVPSPPVAEAPHVTEDAPAAQKTIPETPDVPETDPGDDDTAYAAEPSVAARLVAGKMRRLRANPEAVAAARDRLSEIRARLG